ncbi:protein psiB [Chelativorans salis]|uniref:Protein psiB n=1 Tax=Chelativorans salis TaxID=2978478 RepID=A0ABT2LTX8_9HYPH|nr:protein psiB [Chelativorans sp. EGI FJ00035]MCT7377964.1 protein psiB [Chelativorans sp. EGI FJ00035]
MTKTTILYVLDPETTIFRGVTVSADAGIKGIYELIGSRKIDAVLFDERHSLYLNNDGLKDGLTAYTIFDGYPQPLAGKLVLAAESRDRLYRTPLMSLTAAARHFECCRPVLDPVYATGCGSNRKGMLFVGALCGFQARIERRAPTVTEGEA